jgi:phosphate transport system permease protein
VQASALSILVLFAFFGVFLAVKSLPAFQKFGLGFLVSSSWNPVKDVYGALPVIFGTVVSSLIAILIATPISIGVALFLTDIAPKKPAMILGFLVQMLAAIPSVVYGLWGIFVLAPVFQRTVEPFLGSTLGFLPLFQGAPYGVGMLTAGLILAIMIIPTISSISQEIFKAVPRPQKEAALALGSTRWEMVKIAVFSASKAGVLGAVILGLGRALGETMAVTMVIGNRSAISTSLFAPAQTMASVIANEYGEATHDLHIASLAAIGLTLFAVTFALNSVARWFVWKFTAEAGGRT